MRPLILAALAAAGLLGACATTGSSVTLLSDEGAATGGAVAVLDAKSGAERGALTAVNTRAELGGGKVLPKPVDPGPYAALFAGLPPAARHYTLYFIEGTTNLTDESKPTLEALRTIVAEGSEVQITGHTDTVGSSDSNDKLSLERAAEVRAALVKQGLPVASARVTGRGEREPKVATADNVSEPQNRRVEVIVR